MLSLGTEKGIDMGGGADGTDASDGDAVGPEAAEAAEADVVGTESDVAADDAAEQSDKDTGRSGEVVQQKPTKADARRVSVSLSLRTLLMAMLIAASLVAVVVLTWLHITDKSKLDELGRQAANNSHAERIALDYAVGAATINSQDLDAWKKNLVKGTNSDLQKKLSSAGASMEQILVPLQWNSTATPLIAKVRSNANGIYIVDTFVGVQTKTVQAPDALQSTATYSITVDSNHDWQISEVGGIGAVVGQK